LPRDETYGLRAQMRRATVSIPSNIAEGQGRRTPNDEMRFLSIARGSLCELQTQITLCQRLHYISSETASALMATTSRVAKLINGTLRELASRT
jgi:four helix bundle protein